VGAAVAADADQLDLVGVGTTELEIALTHKIVEHVPSAERVLLCVTGTRRRKIVKFQGCFHGANDYLLANVISPREKLGRHDPRSAGMLPEVLRETLVAEFNDLDAVTSLFEAYRGDIAAVIVEPIPHNIGAILPQPGFLEGVRSLTREHGVILIFDEVITGFRHGLGGYQADLESPPI
jgi:glutamate-1-semialdehyde 2,1-aminomutase